MEEVVNYETLEWSTTVSDTGQYQFITQENLVYMTEDGSTVGIDNLIEEDVVAEEIQPEMAVEEQVGAEEVMTEVITDDWANDGEDCVEVTVDQITTTPADEDDFEVPLPDMQDEYTASRPYPCDFCPRRFRKKANLMNHMVAHQNDRPHVCNLCGLRYIRKSDLLNHLQTHAYSEDGYGEDFNDYVDDFQEVHTNKELDNLLLASPSTSRKRKTSIKLESLPPLPVIPSRGRKRTSSNWEIDWKTLLEAEAEPPSKLTADKPAPPTPVTVKKERQQQPLFEVIDPRKPFVCQHCGVSFAREKALESHARVHVGDSPLECEICGDIFWNVTKLQEHQRRHESRAPAQGDFLPEVGGAEEEVGETAEAEMEEDETTESDTETKPFIADLHFAAPEEGEGQGEGHCCNTCGETFAEALDLLAHAEVHARAQPFKCLLCGDAFVEEHQIKTHIAERHGEELTENSCRICGKLCRDGRSLMKHSWDHSREKSHSCGKCGKTFFNKARLKRHMISHRNKTVACDVCGLCFADGRQLMNHRHAHSKNNQYPCSECGKTFGSRSSQQIHMRIHTGERPYGCRYCWKAFADGGTLRKHERIHTGEKPYACPLPSCQRAFNQRVVLREHIRSHHSTPDIRMGSSIHPYYCGVCGDAFSAGADLVLHLIHHSDLNTALKRTPIVGPRKYKRRRGLKPHEIPRGSGSGSAPLKSKQEELSSGDDDDDELEDEEESTPTRKETITFDSIRRKPSNQFIPLRATNTSTRSSYDRDALTAAFETTTEANRTNLRSTSPLRRSSRRTTAARPTYTDGYLEEDPDAAPPPELTQKFTSDVVNDLRKILESPVKQPIAARPPPKTPPPSTRPRRHIKPTPKGEALAQSRRHHRRQDVTPTKSDFDPSKEIKEEPHDEDDHDECADEPSPAMKSEDGGLFRCDMCTSRFSDRNHLMQHVTLNHI